MFQSESDSFLEVTDPTTTFVPKRSITLPIDEIKFEPMTTVSTKEIKIPERNGFKRYFKQGVSKKMELKDKSKHIPWIDAFTIDHSSDIISNVDYGLLIEWLNMWSKKLDSINKTNEPPSKKRRQNKYNEDDDYELENHKFDEMDNTFVIYGPTGCGKTSLVKYCINKCDFNAIELSVSDLRSSTVLKKTLSGAIENFAVRKSNDIRSMFSVKKFTPKKSIIFIDDVGTIILLFFKVS